MMMNTTKVVHPPKVKGLLKGLRYISQIFDEEKEEEMQIGVPTDVKHVAHIGSDGPSNDAPSWMKDFKPSSSTDSCPNKEDDPDVKWVSEDSKRGDKSVNSPRKDAENASRSSRRHHSSEGSNSPRRNTKTRSSRKLKESSEGNIKSNISSQTSDVPPDAPKKTRRRKSKESGSAHGSGRSKTKSSNAPALADDDSVSQKSGPQDGDE